MRHMAILAAAILAIPAGAQNRVDRALPLNADGAVRIHALNGSISVRGWERDSVVIRGDIGERNRLHAGGSRSGIKAFIEPQDERDPAPSRLEILVPARAKLWIKTATATLVVSGVSGSVDAYVIGGSIQITGDPADLNAEAIDGSIEIVGSPGWVRAKSAGGNVTLRGASRDVTLSTVTGRIVVNAPAKGARFERARLESVTGDIAFMGAVERGGDVRFDSNRGAVNVTLRSGADVEATTITGTIRNGVSSSRPARGRYGRGSELTTTAGDGGARVSVRTFSGAITFNRGS